MSDHTFQPHDYEELCRFLESTCGLVLGENKHYLVTSRLSRLMAEFSVRTIGELLGELKRGVKPGLRERVIEAMTTNETSWFRDTFPYEILKNIILPDLATKGSGPIRVWSAASSSGQEAYSISMTVSEFQAARPGVLKRDVQIVGTDISSAVVKEAREGSYDQLAMARGLTAERRDRFFVRQGERWQVRPEIRARTSFREFNLLDNYALLGRFDIVFCRNVLIYFSAESKKDIVRRIAQALTPGGYFFLGASESMINYAEHFEMVRCNPGVVYRKK